MTSLLYCLEGAHRKGLAGTVSSPSDVQTEVLTRTAVSAVKKREEKTKEQKVQNQTTSSGNRISPLMPISGLFIEPAQSGPSGGSDGAFWANGVRQLTDGWIKGEQSGSLCLAAQICSASLCWSYTLRSRAQQGTGWKHVIWCNGHWCCRPCTCTATPICVSNSRRHRDAVAIAKWPPGLTVWEKPLMEWWSAAAKNQSQWRDPLTLSGG